MIKKDKGITLISLSIAVIIILTITGMILYSAKDGIYIEKLTNMQNDIKNLRDKVSSYYSEYGEIPAKTEYPDITNLQAAGVIGANDTGKFFILELEKLEGLTLNYGEDYEKYKVNDYTNLEDLTDIYIINETSHNIFYVEGIRVKEKDGTKIYYTDYTEGDKEAVQIVEITEIDGVQIPRDFYYVGGTKDTGIVISDVEGDDLDNTAEGNQFVWVPVDNYKEFVRRAGYWEGKEQTLTSDYGEADGSENNTNSIETEETKKEAQEMYASVKKYGGFYIGRYETGRDSNSNAVVKKGVDVYDNVQWSANGTMQESNEKTGGAVELSRSFDEANDYTTVTSTLIYGVQWDAVMKWMEDIENPHVTGTLTKYIQNSEGMGWYSNNYENIVHQAGTNVDEDRSNCVNNIYDLAGNTYEWTMESYNNTERVVRGGICIWTGSNNPASVRGNNTPSSKTTGVGFRVALYMK